MNLPEWAKYVARDDDGCVFAFENKPYKDEDEDEWLKAAGEHCQLPDASYPHVKWEDEQPTELTPAEDSIIKPDHYLNENGQDLFEQWYHRYPFTTFLAIMECIEERYNFRASRKNGDEDLKKAQEDRDRKLEYINRHHIENIKSFRV